MFGTKLEKTLQWQLGCKEGWTPFQLPNLVGLWKHDLCKMINLVDVLNQILTDAINMVLSVTQVECLREMLYPHTTMILTLHWNKLVLLKMIILTDWSGLSFSKFRRKSSDSLTDGLGELNDSNITCFVLDS